MHTEWLTPNKCEPPARLSSVVELLAVFLEKRTLLTTVFLLAKISILMQSCKYFGKFISLKNNYLCCRRSWRAESLYILIDYKLIRNRHRLCSCCWWIFERTGDRSLSCSAVSRFVVCSAKKRIFKKVGVRHIWGVMHCNTMSLGCDELFEFVTSSSHFVTYSII